MGVSRVNSTDPAIVHQAQFAHPLMIIRNCSLVRGTYTNFLALGGIRQTLDEDVDALLQRLCEFADRALEHLLSLNAADGRGPVAGLPAKVVAHRRLRGDEDQEIEHEKPDVEQLQ